MQVNIIGDIFGSSGYARHTRGLTNGLNEIGCDVRIESNLVPQWEREVNDFELNAIGKQFDSNATTIMISQPPAWRIGLAQKPKHFFGFCVWEGQEIPSYWLPYLADKRVDKILVPSKHTKQAILNTVNKNYSWMSLIKNKIVIIPHGYDNAKYYPEEIKKDKFTFIANKGWSQGEFDRGGIQFLLKAYLEEFTNKDDVQLKLKINPAYNPPGWKFNDECKKIGIVKKDSMPDLLLAEGFLDDNGLRQFYNEGDIFVSTSMAEAFNLPCLEAMACGVPVIAPAFGGQSDFVNNTNGWLLKEGTIGVFSQELQYEEIQWFKLDIKEIRSKLRLAYNNRKRTGNKVKKALETASKYTWIHSAKKLKEFF